MNAAAVLAPLAWKLIKPLLKMSAKALRDKWAEELSEEDQKQQQSTKGAPCTTLSKSRPQPPLL